MQALPPDIHTSGVSLTSHQYYECVLSFIFLELGIENSKYALCMGLYSCWLLIIYTQVHIPLLLSYQKAVTGENRLLTGYFNEEEGETRENGAY